jgi:peptidoglycan/xylan/chitin deacetylase (PgdA/CDA1 family)
MYHEISEPANATWRRLAVSPDVFREQLAYLRDAGYTTLTGEAIAAALAEGSREPPRTVVLTGAPPGTRTCLSPDHKQVANQGMRG